MNLLPKNAEIVIAASITLHNFLLSSEPFKKPEVHPVEEPPIFLSRAKGKFPSIGYHQRAALCKFFNEEGRISWQDEKINSTSRNKRLS